VPDTFLIRVCAWLIVAGSCLAPRWRRDDWRREWMGELHVHASRLASAQRLTPSAEWRLVARCLGSALHLAFLWRHEWRLDMVTQDLRYGVRLFARRPTFASMAILTLALGIGATTAIFSAVDAVLLRSLPYPRPEQLIRISSLDLKDPHPSARNLSLPDVRDFERRTSSFQAIGAYNATGYFTLTGGGDPERVARALVTSGYFRALGVQPMLGRFFTPEEDRPSPPAEVVLSYGFWQRQFGGDRTVIGRLMTLSGVTGPIIGVAPQTFAHPDPKIEAAPDVFVLADPDEQQSPRSGRYLRAVARLKDGVSIDHASADLQAVAASLAIAYPSSSFGKSTIVEPLRAVVTGESRAPLWLLQAATLAILLIGCANLASLMLGFASGRATELATRAALGAARTRLVRQLVTESLVLAAAGGLAGVAVAKAGTAWLAHAVGHMLLPGQRLAVGGDVLAFAAVISLVVGVTCGLAPALRVSRTASLTTRQRGGTGSRSDHRLRAVLVGGEVAITMVLLVTSVLFVRSFSALSAVDPGFQPANLFSFQVAVQTADAPNGGAPVLYERLYDRIRHLPGVTSVGGVSILPLSGNFSCDGIQIEGRAVPKGAAPCAEARSASVDYFKTMGVALRAGRRFTERDDANAPHVVVINEALAAKFYPGENPIGRRMVYAARGQNDAREIVGIVRDVHQFGLDETPAPEFYTPEAQPPSFGVMTVVVASREASFALIPAIRADMHELAPKVPMYNVRMVRDVLQESVSAARVRTSLLATFAALALILAVVGTYGVASIAVTERTREMGIRLALGAAPRTLVEQAVLAGLRPVMLGAAAGLGAALVLSRLLTSLLFRIHPLDPVTLAVAPVVLLAAGLIAAWIPARRAIGVDPVGALRAE
jgi:putative ABC transport system permease protein